MHYLITKVEKQAQKVEDDSEQGYHYEPAVSLRHARVADDAEVIDLRARRDAGDGRLHDLKIFHLEIDDDGVPTLGQEI